MNDKFVDTFLELHQVIVHFETHMCETCRHEVISLITECLSQHFAGFKGQMNQHKGRSLYLYLKSVAQCCPCWWCNWLWGLNKYRISG